MDLKNLIPEKARAKICNSCPLCRHSRNRPDSVVGRLHAKYHVEDCPMWEAQREVYGETDEAISPSSETR